MADTRGVDVLGSRRIGPNWSISGQKAGIIAPHLQHTATKSASMGLFNGLFICEGAALFHFNKCQNGKFLGAG